MVKSRNILPPKRWWTADEEALLRQRYASTRTPELAQALGRPSKQVLAKAATMGLHKSPALIAEIAREHTMAPDHGGRRTRIQPGQVPWNKGKAGATGLHPNCKATQFKPGSKPHTWLPLGSYRTLEGGTILERKISETPGPNHRRWTPVHRLVWEAAHGPVPAGHLVVFKPGRSTAELERITLDAVELVTRAEHMRRNSFWTQYPPELARLTQLRGALSRAINAKAKEANSSTHQEFTHEH